MKLTRRQLRRLISEQVSVMTSGDIDGGGGSGAKKIGIFDIKDSEDFFKVIKGAKVVGSEKDYLDSQDKKGYLINLCKDNSELDLLFYKARNRFYVFDCDTGVIVRLIDEQIEGDSKNANDVVASLRKKLEKVAPERKE